MFKFGEISLFFRIQKQIIETSEIKQSVEMLIVSITSHISKRTLAIVQIILWHRVVCVMK